MKRLLMPCVVFALASCGGPPPPEPPEGFTLEVHLVSIDLEAIDTVRLRLHPPAGTRFQEIEETTFEGGAIVLRSDPDSSLVFQIGGPHVRAHAVPASEGAGYVYELQIWSDDPVMREGGPLVIGSASRGGQFIGDGTVYLPAWPPPIEVEGECQASRCTVPLTISCTSEAASMGLCRR